MRRRPGTAVAILCPGYSCASNRPGSELQHHLGAATRLLQSAQHSILSLQCSRRPHDHLLSQHWLLGGLSVYHGQQAITHRRRARDACACATVTAAWARQAPSSCCSMTSRGGSVASPGAVAVIHREFGPSPVRPRSSLARPVGRAVKQALASEPSS